MGQNPEPLKSATDGFCVIYGSIGRFDAWNAFIPQTDLSEWGSHGVDKGPWTRRAQLIDPRSSFLLLYCGLGDTYLHHSHTKQGVAGFTLVKIYENRPTCQICCVYHAEFRPFVRYAVNSMQKSTFLRFSASDPPGCLLGVSGCLLVPPGVSWVSLGSPGCLLGVSWVSPGSLLGVS